VAQTFLGLYLKVKSSLKMRWLISLSFFISFSCFGQLPEASLAPVNSQYDELNPVLHPDGQTLYFSIARHPSNVGGMRDPGDIWMSKWTGSGWSAPTHMGSRVNDRTFNAVAGFSPDGKELYLLSHYDHTGNAARTQGISVSRLSSDGWSHPQNISIPYFQNKSTFLCGALTQDMKVFIFSAETYGTHGVDDIYVSLNENGKWGEPINLGNVINTQFQEVSPSLSEDGKTLYFSSNGRKGIGSFDIYSTTRLDDTWRAWSEPVNLGSALNSDGRELYFRDYARLGLSLYASTKNSDGYGDLRFHKSKEIPVQTDSTVNVIASVDTAVVSLPDTATTVKTTVPETTPVIRIFGTVTNSKTGEPVSATLSFTSPSLPAEKVATDNNTYDVSLTPRQSYAVRIEAPGFVSALEKLDVHDYQSNELEMNFSLQPVEIGTTVNLKSVLFVQTKTELLPESFDELDVVVSFLKANPSVRIELSGHTDNRGVHADNVRLSQARVNSVKKYLVSKGIDAKRISGKGYGGTKPIASNDSEETRRMNRRVEFIIKKF
jgi:OmpA-OmpF porin, OOP family